MKLRFEKQALNHMFLNIGVIILGISFYFALLNFSVIHRFFSDALHILRPFVYGFVIAFLLNNPVKYFDRLLFRLIRQERIRRAVSVSVVMLITLLLIGLLVAFLVPQLIDSAMTLVMNVQDFALNMDSNLETRFSALMNEYHMSPDVYKKVVEAWDHILSLGSSLLVAGFQYLLGLTGQVTNWVINLFVAVIISVYLLMSREQFFAQLRKVLYAFFNRKTVEQLLYVGRLTNRTFNGFINGKLIDSLIIGILAFICLNIMKMPYVLLISVIIGVTNVIPFFGPFVGAIPSAFIIFIVDPIQAVWFCVFILILQQIDGNIIGPKILGGTTGMPAIWVMFAILVGGGMAGFVGMVVGVPTVAVLYTLFKRYLKQRLTSKALPFATESYLAADYDPYQEKERECDETTSNESDAQPAAADRGDGARD